MAAISQTTLSNAYSWMKMLEIWLIFHQSLFLRFQSIDNIPALVEIMAWRRPGDKPLSEPVIVRLLMHICVSRLQWVKVVICRLMALSHYLDQCWLYVSWTLRSRFPCNSDKASKFSFKEMSLKVIYTKCLPQCVISLMGLPAVCNCNPPKANDIWEIIWCVLRRFLTTSVSV